MVYSNNYGLNDNFEYLELALDSAEAQVSADGANFLTPGNRILNYPLFQVAGRQPLRGIAAIKVLEVQIPFTWYVIPDGQNTFNLRVVGPSVVNATITIPPGNYTAASLVSLLNTLCLATATGAYTDVVWQFNDSSGKLEVALDQVPAPGLNTFQISITSNYLRGLLGANSVTNYFPTVNLQYFSQPRVLQISGANYLYLNSNALGPNVNMYQPRTSAIGGNSGPQIAKIPVNVSPGGIIYWQDPDPQKWFSADNLDSLINLDMFLSLGTSRDVLELNGASFSVKLGLLLWISDATSYNTTARTMAKRE